MDCLPVRIESLNKKIDVMLVRGEEQNSLQVIKELSELLSDTLDCIYKDKNKEIESNIQSFIAYRIANIVSNQMPIKFESDTKAIFHLIPTSAFKQEQQQIDMTALQQKTTQFSPFGHGSYDFRYNYDGYLTYNKNVYTQVFRNGCIESVSSRFYNESEKRFFASRFESTVINITTQYIKVLNELGIKGPFYIYITLIGIEDYALAVPFRYIADYKIDRKEISLPRVKIEETENITSPLKKAFDVLWNAGGFPGSINYKNGEWNPNY